MVGTSPAGAISPTTLAKPDIAATDCGVTTYFGYWDGSNWRFCGTSAAAPHAAAVAALQYQHTPSASFAEIRAAQNDNASPIGAFPHTAAGADLLNANAAMGPSDTDPPETIIDSGPPAYTTDTSPTFTFHSDEPGSTFECRDGRAAGPRWLDPMHLPVHTRPGRRLVHGLDPGD